MDAETLEARGIEPLTRADYEWHFRRFKSWCDAHDVPSLPTSERVIAAYWLELIERGYSESYIWRSGTAIGRFHALAGLRNPTRTLLLRNMLRAIEKSSRRRKIRAITIEQLRDILARNDVLFRPIIAARNRVVILLGFFAALASTDICRINFDDVTIDENGLLIRISQVRASRRAELTVAIARHRDPMLCTVRAVADWIALAPIADGALVRRVLPKTNRIPAGRYKVGNARPMVGNLGRDIGLGYLEFQALRYGFLELAVNSNVPLRDIMSHVGVKSVASFERTLRERGFPILSRVEDKSRKIRVRHKLRRDYRKPGFPGSY